MKRQSLQLPPCIASIVGEQRCFDENTIGMSDSSVLIFDDMVLKIEKQCPESNQEHTMMKWLQGKVPVPKVLCSTCENGINYLLMSKADGLMSCSEKYMLQPDVLTSALAESLKVLWSTDISDCPCLSTIDPKLELAEARVKNGLVDPAKCDPRTFSEEGEGFRDPQDLLDWLKANKPDEELVLSHGDFCLPNVFLKDGHLNCFIDLGRCGIGDKWNDIAILCRSLNSNFRGEYGGRVYDGYRDELLFNHLGITPDDAKMRYYRLLDELF